MFLVCNSNVIHILEYILCFIQENSVLMGIIISMIVSSLWFKKFIRQKRAEAFFGFYAKFSLRLRALHKKLEESGQLNISDIKAGNIFSLMYTDDLMGNVCPKYKNPNEDMILYKDAASELKDILLNTDNNVYPQGADREKWYESQHILFEFCEFLENETYQKRTNKELWQGENEPKHIIKCRALINAMDYIQKAINDAQY